MGITAEKVRSVLFGAPSHQFAGRPFVDTFREAHRDGRRSATKGRMISRHLKKEQLGGRYKAQMVHYG